MEKKENYLEQVLQNLPQGTITYTQKKNSSMNIPYTLTVKNYKEMYLNDVVKQPDLSPEEQLILINANNSDPTYNPSTVLAGIFRARKISERSTSPLEAIQKCNQVLIDLNQATFKRRDTISQEVSKLRMHANLLEYYLKVEQKCSEYDRKQSSVTAPIRNFANKILEKITRKPHVGPPFSQDERDRGLAEWEKFRAEQSADPNISNKKLLKRYRYNSDLATGDAFDFLYRESELSSLEEDYATTNIALQVLDGSAYKKAERALNDHPKSYIERVKKLNKTREK